MNSSNKTLNIKFLGHAEDLFLLLLVSKTKSVVSRSKVFVNSSKSSASQTCKLFGHELYQYEY